MKISINELEELTRKAAKKYGYNDKEVQVIADVLLYAQVMDRSFQQRRLLEGKSTDNIMQVHQVIADIRKWQAEHQEEDKE